MPSARSSSGVWSARANSSPIDVHLGLAHAAGGHRRRADADAARDHRRILIERNRVLVDRDAGLAERRLGHLARDAFREHVHEHQVVVGAAADEAESRSDQRAREPLRVGHDLLLVGDERRLRRLFEADRLGRDDVHQRTALHAGKDRPVEILCVLLAAQDQPASRPAQRLVRGCRDEIGMGHRAGMHARGDQSGDVRHVGENRRADSVGRDANAREIDHARIRAGADDDHLRTMLVGQPIDLVVVDLLVRLPDAVRNDRVQLPREIERMAVRQMAAVRQVHPEHRVARFQQRQVDRHVGLRAGVRLDVGVIGAKQCRRARNRRPFDDVDELAASVVALAGVALGVLVRQHRSGGFENRLAHEILRGDQLETAVLAVQLVAKRGGDFGIGFGKSAPHRWGGCVGGHVCFARLKNVRFRQNRDCSAALI